MNPYGACRFFYSAVLPMLLLLASPSSAGPMTRRSSGTAGDAATSPESAADSLQARKQWASRVESVIHNDLSSVCQNFVPKFLDTENPQEACDMFQDNKGILKFACTAKDIQLTEEVICSFSLTSASTNQSPKESPSNSSPPSSASSSSSSPPPTTSTTTTTITTVAVLPPALPTETHIAREPVTATSTKTTATTTTKKASTTTSSVKPLRKGEDGNTESAQSQAENQTSPDKVTDEDNLTSSYPTPVVKSSSELPPSDEEATTQQRDTHDSESLPTHDSRLSDACNVHLRHLARLLSQDDSSVSCHKIHLLSQDSATTHSGLAQEEAIRASCDAEERYLLHGILCTGRNNGPTHVMPGQQLKRVNYVIETELTSSCRDALSPLGEGRMKEDVQDSCLTLRGVEGNQLVTNEVCTRRDLDNLLQAACDSAPGLLASGYRTFIAVALSVVTYLVNACL